MPETRKPREFPCGDQRWKVVRHAATQQNNPSDKSASAKQTGLYFECDGTTRFLAFTRGAMPSENDLSSMSEEVLCVLLRRAKAG